MSSELAGGGKPRYLLDTSALLTFSGDEPGADAVGALLAKGRRGEIHVYMAFLSVMEAGYKAYQRAAKTAWQPCSLPSSSSPSLAWMSAMS